MKRSMLHRKGMLWTARFVKLSMLAIPMVLVTALEHGTREKPNFGKMIKSLPKRLFFLIRLFYRQFLNKDFLNSKCIVVNYEDCRPIGPSLNGLVAFAWICEKMKINVKIKKPNNMVLRHFENNTLINNTNKSTHGT